MLPVEHLVCYTAAVLDPLHKQRLDSARVARLSTASAAGVPHCVPVCYAVDGQRILIALDQKPKTVGVHALRRVRNVLANPRAALLVDRYSDEWTQLWFLLLECEAGLCELTQPQLALLRERYPQYRSMDLGPALYLDPTRVVFWSAIDAGGSMGPAG